MATYNTEYARKSEVTHKTRKAKDNRKSLNLNFSLRKKKHI